MSKHSKKIKRELELKNRSNANTGDIPLEQVIEELKKKILQEVREISNGIKMTAFPLVELDKELQVLEKELEAKVDASADFT